MKDRDYMSPQKVPCHSHLRLPDQRAEHRPADGREGPHRRILALHTAAVETHGGHALLPPLHADHALVVLLARLRLRQVLGPQGKRLHDADWDQEVPTR